MYRVDGGAWQTWAGAPLVAEALFSGANSSHVLEARCGDSGAVLSRAIVFNPDYPAPAEHHGYLLWADEAERQALVHKLNNVQPFKISYQNCFRSDSWVQGLPGKSHGPARRVALLAKRSGQCPVQRTRRGRRRPGDAGSRRSSSSGCCGCRGSSRSASRSTLTRSRRPRTTSANSARRKRLWVDAAVAYDIAAGFYRSTQHPGGLTPIEEIQVRDGLAKVAKSLLQFRDNYSRHLRRRRHALAAGLRAEPGRHRPGHADLQDALLRRQRRRPPDGQRPPRRATASTGTRSPTRA